MKRHLKQTALWILIITFVLAMFQAPAFARDDVSKADVQYEEDAFEAGSYEDTNVVSDEQVYVEDKSFLDEDVSDDDAAANIEDPEDETVFSDDVAEDVSDDLKHDATEEISFGADKDANDAYPVSEDVYEEPEASDGENVLEEDASKDDSNSVKKNAKKASSIKKGEVINGSFDASENMDIATVRFYTDEGKSDYAFASFSYDEASGKYDYSFEAPYDGFENVQAASFDDISNATIIAEYYSTVKWDGAVDVSWYNEEDTDFYIYNPAELAGFAAIVNGSVDGDIHDYQVKGERSNLLDRGINRGLPDFIESTYYERTDLIAGVQDEAWKGVMKHDFADRAVHIMNDMDMGGVPGSQIDHSLNTVVNEKTKEGTNAYDYPNWTPIGGEYLMDVSDSSTMIIAFFNGTIEGHGHNIDNVYCYRWSWPSVGETAYGYAQGTGFVGMMGSLYNDDRGEEENPSIMPTVRNLGLSGYIYGRRMVGGIVGCIGGGSNAAAGESVPGGIALENLANHADVYCTDSKGLGGIVACSMSKGSVINCYNDGYMCANYAAPTGGIIGSNEYMDVFSCYNIGQVNSNKNHRGRGIGGDSAGTNYTVDDCFYLEGTSDDPNYPGYYSWNLAPSVHVNVTAMTEAQMSNGTLLKALNRNGLAYLEGDDGYPVLYWEKASGMGNVSLDAAPGGSITAVKTGTLENGTVVYLENQADTGWNFRNYTLNGEPVSGDYITVNGDCVVSGFFESAQAGVLRIEQNNVCNISVKKNGTIINESGGAESVTNWPVNAGDPLYEGDLLIVEANIKDGVEPPDPSYQYSATADLAVPFDYFYTYTGKEPESTTKKTFTVGKEISGDDVSLLLDVVPRTTHKLWRYIGDTSWYDENKDEFVITRPEELAGLQVLVMNGKKFSGKTVKLGNDISLKNNDGSGGDRFWDGIGLSTSSFAGTFDGQGYSIKDMDSNMRGLFAYVEGKSDSEKAVIKDVDVYGKVDGVDASGIAFSGKNCEIKNCDSYARLFGTSGRSGGIIGYAQSGCTVTDCNNYGKISSVGKVGGIAGEMARDSRVERCINKGDIYCLDEGDNNVGGVVGSLNASVNTCANYGNITVYGRSAGGVAGQSVSAKSEIFNCYNAGDITFENGGQSSDTIGGIIGFASFYNTKNSFNYGNLNNSGSGSAPNEGGLFGREYETNGTKGRSTNVTDNIYYLDSSSKYADFNIAYENLPTAEQAKWRKGMNIADAAQFASKTGVLAAINGDDKYVLTNGKFPEFDFAAETHVHKGGKASCRQYAICEICGLEYGGFDAENHVDLVTRNIREAVWSTDGYSGDVYCRDCGELVEPGSIIKADTTRHAMNMKYYNEGELVKTTAYKVSELDEIKTTSPAIGYSYGANSTEKMVATEYVTIEKLLEEDGLTFDDIEKIVVICSGSRDTISVDILKSCDLYYDENGNKFSAPPAISMHYTSLSGTLEQVAQESKPNNNLRFGFGISEEQYANNESLGGRRLVSPVEAIEVTLKEDISKVESLEITKKPDHTDYHIGDVFQKDGMVVTAKMKDGTEKIVDDYEIEQTDGLEPSDKEVNITYGWKNAKVPVTVTDHNYDASTHKCIEKRYDGSICGEDEPADKSALEDAIKAAEDAENDVAVSTDGKDIEPSDKWVSKADKDALDKAIADAKKVLDDEDATQDEVDAAVKAVADAQKKFEDAKKSGTKPQTVAVTGVSLDKTSANATAGDSVQLKATVSPSNATDKTVTWKSSDTSVATVDVNGKVTTKKAGTVTITATTKDGNKTATCKITVKAKEESATKPQTVAVTGVKIDKTSANATAGDSVQLKATVSPSNATNKTVTWKSSDTSVATVDANGKVTTKKAGTVTITATTKDGNKTATCNITVKAKEQPTTKPQTVAVTGIKITPASAELATKKTLQMKVEITPSNATNKAVTWKSSDTSIATVDKNGKVTAIKYGKPVTITATTNDGKKVATAKIQTRFYDVNDKNNQYYWTPVYWAADKNITKGYTDNKNVASDSVYFGPKQNCTRKEMIIFLWRLSGKPSASGSLPFSDTKKMNKNSDGYKAVLWGYKNGIIRGYESGKYKGQFRLNDSVARKDTLIMLYRLAKKPKVSGKIKFPDVVKQNYKPTSDTYKAILWGTQKKITNGYKDGNFKPFDNCLREHIVTFIYRFDKNVK